MQTVRWAHRRSIVHKPSCDGCRRLRHSSRGEAIPHIIYAWAEHGRGPSSKRTVNDNVNVNDTISNPMTTMCHSRVVLHPATHAHECLTFRSLSTIVLCARVVIHDSPSIHRCGASNKMRQLCANNTIAFRENSRKTNIIKCSCDCLFSVRGLVSPNT